MQFRASQTKLLRTLSSSSTPLSSSIHQYTNNRAAEQKCLSLLQSTNSLSNLTQIHAHILKLGLHNNPLVLTKFTSTSSDLHVTDYASSFLFSPESDTRLYDSFLFNTIIRAYAQTTNSKFKAFSMYKLMLQFNVFPNKFTFPFLLKACAGIGDLKLGKSVHGSVLKLGFEFDDYVRMYCCDIEGVEFAHKVFDEMPKLDSISWSTMIGGLGMSSELVELFRKMQIENVCPDEITMVSVLSACSDIGKALNLFRNVNQKDIVSWTSLIGGLAMHGRGLEAVSLFEEMIENGVPGRGFIHRVAFCL